MIDSCYVEIVEELCCLEKRHIFVCLREVSNGKLLLPATDTTAYNVHLVFCLLRVGIIGRSRLHTQIG